MNCPEFACFESETIFGPLVADESDNVLKVNESHWNRGLPRNMLVFLSGVCLSVSFVDRRRHRNRLLSLRPGSYHVQHWFDTFNGWYQMTLRSQYAGRYDLNTNWVLINRLNTVRAMLVCELSETANLRTR